MFSEKPAHEMHLFVRMRQSWNLLGGSKHNGMWLLVGIQKGSVTHAINTYRVAEDSMQ